MSIDASNDRTQTEVNEIVQQLEAVLAQVNGRITDEQRRTLENLRDALFAAELELYGDDEERAMLETPYDSLYASVTAALTPPKQPHARAWRKKQRTGGKIHGEFRYKLRGT